MERVGWEVKPYEGQLVFMNAEGEAKYIPPVMPWRLQIAAQFFAVRLSNTDLKVTITSEELAVLSLERADALIKAHEETK